jgi:hypothetical protein
MARGGYEPEIKASMGTGQPGRVNTSPRKPSPAAADSPAEVARDTKAGITQNSPADIRQDAMQAAQAPQAPRPPGHLGDIPHVAAATSIAHAILNRRPGGM